MVGRWSEAVAPDRLTGKAGSRVEGVMARASQTAVRALSRIPGGSSALARIAEPICRVQDAARSMVLPQFVDSDVVHLIWSLRRERIDACIGGGWGIDALLGHTSRYHHDLDIVLREGNADLPGVIATLASLGYDQIAVDEGGWWTSSRVSFKDSAGRLIEVLAIDWDSVCKYHDQKKALRFELHRPTICVSGLLGGRIVPCLSVEAQLAFHRGYAERAKDRLAVKRLERQGFLSCSAPLGRPTALVVPFLGIARHEGWRARLLPRGFPGLPPHVTIVWPFVDDYAVDEGLLSVLRDIASGISAFPVSLERVEWFGDQVLWLAPVPAEPFAKLIEQVNEALPAYRPYAGSFPEVIPHLTIMERRPVALMRLAARLIEGGTPISAHATSLWLMGQGTDGAWRRISSFELRCGAER
ncbi:MAG: 2'-5' RNA ligase family protein [Acidimicrobiales bacterium]